MALTYSKAQLSERLILAEFRPKQSLDMRGSLDSLEREKIEAEYNDLMELIRRLTEILSSEANIMAIIEDRWQYRNRFPGERRTELRVGELTSIR